MMGNEMELKYGCNPNQTPARIFCEDGDLPLRVHAGRPGYINLLDALNGYALVRELSEVTGRSAAASFKHVSPAGAALGLPIEPALAHALFTEGELSPLAAAYARARGCDRMSSFGDFIALSDPCDVSTARLIAREVSDGIIAPGYEPEALSILAKKRKGTYAVLSIDPAYAPKPLERKDVYGITFEQARNEQRIDRDLLSRVVTAATDLPEAAVQDLLLAMITLKYTQSNSVCFAKGGQTIGVGAGQQSRIHCTRLAARKADLWHLRQHPAVAALPFLAEIGRPERDNAVDRFLSDDPQETMDLLAEGSWQGLFAHRPEPLPLEEQKRYLADIDGVSLGSDAFFPFDDNILRAARSGVRYIAQPGGSLRDPSVIAACDRLGIVMAFTGVRLFHH